MICTLFLKKTKPIIYYRCRFLKNRHLHQTELTRRAERHASLIHSAHHTALSTRLSHASLSHSRLSLSLGTGPAEATTPATTPSPLPDPAGGEAAASGDGGTDGRGRGASDGKEK